MSSVIFPRMEKTLKNTHGNTKYTKGKNLEMSSSINELTLPPHENL